jgi:hypothetical protein
MSYGVKFCGDSTEENGLFTTQKKAIRTVTNAQGRELS